MNYRMILAAVLVLGAGAANADTKPAKPMAAAKGVKCGDSYIAAGKTCTKTPAKPVGKGVKCGDSYIAAGQVCHKTTAMTPAKPAMAKPAMAAPAKPMAAKAAPAKMAAAPMKAKGKKCGNGYIAATATCTKK